MPDAAKACGYCGRRFAPTASTDPVGRRPDPAAGRPRDRHRRTGIAVAVVAAVAALAAGAVWAVSRDDGAGRTVAAPEDGGLPTDPGPGPTPAPPEPDDGNGPEPPVEATEPVPEEPVGDGSDAGADAGPGATEPDPVAAVAHHWDEYTAAWAEGDAAGAAFQASRNMYAVGPVACGLTYADSTDASLEIVADPTSVERDDEWRPPFPDRLLSRTADIYRVTVDIGGDRLDLHVAVLDGQTRHFITCTPSWEGSWAREADDGSSMWTQFSYDLDGDAFLALFLDEIAAVGPCAGSSVLLDAVLEEARTNLDTFVARFQSWCGPPGRLADAAPLELDEYRNDDGDPELVDRRTGSVFTWVGDRFEITFVYDGETDTLTDDAGGTWLRSDRDRVTVHAGQDG